MKNKIKGKKRGKEVCILKQKQKRAFICRRLEDPRPQLPNDRLRRWDLIIDWKE